MRYFGAAARRWRRVTQGSGRFSNWFILRTKKEKSNLRTRRGEFGSFGGRRSQSTHESDDSAPNIKTGSATNVPGN
jgi:hypothetical protein